MSGKAVRETLGFLGVVASLVFVGAEIHQNTKATRSQTRQALSDAVREISDARATNPQLARAWLVFRPDYVADRDIGELTFMDTLMARQAMAGFLRHVENVYLQVQEGVVDQSVLQDYGFTVAAFDSPAFQEFWTTVRGIYDPSFVTAFEEANHLAP